MIQGDSFYSGWMDGWMDIAFFKYVSKFIGIL